MVIRALAFIEDIMYEDHNGLPDQMPEVVMVHFEKYAHVPYKKCSCVPILPVTKFWSAWDVNCTRKQFPLQLPFAITIHQGSQQTRNFWKPGKVREFCGT